MAVSLAAVWALLNTRLRQTLFKRDFVQADLPVRVPDLKIWRVGAALSRRIGVGKLLRLVEVIHPRIFETFWRQDTAHSTPGFGLGLPIAQRIIERHGGEIMVESEAGQGTTVRVSLPVSSSA